MIVGYTFGTHMEPRAEISFFCDIILSPKIKKDQELT